MQQNEICYLFLVLQEGSIIIYTCTLRGTFLVLGPMWGGIVVINPHTGFHTGSLLLGVGVGVSGDGPLCVVSGGTGKDGSYPVHNLDGRVCMGKALCQ